MSWITITKYAEFTNNPRVYKIDKNKINFFSVSQEKVKETNKTLYQLLISFDNQRCLEFTTYNEKELIDWVEQITCEGE